MLRDIGIPLLAVTGRSHNSFHRLVEGLRVEGNFCILDGGATVARATTAEQIDAVFVQGLAPATVRVLAQEVGLLANQIYCENKPLPLTPIELQQKLDDETALTAIIPSFFIVFDVGKGPEVLARLVTLAPQLAIKHTSIMRFQNSPTLSCVQVLSANVDKQFGVIKMLELAGSAGQRTLAIGDNVNDIPLFRVADVRVAMGNAPDELKFLADWVAPPVEQHGYVKALRHFGLI